MMPETKTNLGFKTIYEKPQFIRKQHFNRSKTTLKAQSTYQFLSALVTYLTHIEIRSIFLFVVR